MKKWATDFFEENGYWPSNQDLYKSKNKVVDNKCTCPIIVEHMNDLCEHCMEEYIRWINGKKE